MPRIILHIGTYKTGSTAIQAYMRKHASKLMAQSIVHPAFPGERLGHSSLGQAFRKGDREAAEIRLQAIREAFDKNPDATVVLSSEHFWPMNGPKLHKMLDGLESVCADIRVIMYIRAQDRLWSSLYAQESKLMRIRPDTKLWGDSEAVGRDIADHGMYYFECLEEYSKRFGRDRVSARVYDRKLFPNGSVVSDFLRYLGVPTLPSEKDDPPDVNPSFGWKGVEFSKYFAKRLGEQRYNDSPAPAALRSAVRRLATEDQLSDWIGTPPCYLTEKDQREIRSHYAESNRKLAEAYFAGQDPFSADGLMPVCPFRFSDIPRVELLKAMSYMAEHLRMGEAPVPEVLQGKGFRSWVYKNFGLLQP